MPKIIFLWTDIALFALFGLVLFYVVQVRRSHALRATWSRVLRSAPAMCSAVVLLFFVVIGLLDSIHFQPRLPPAPSAPATAQVVYAPKVVSLLDMLLEDTAFVRPEKTYSEPLAFRQFNKESMLDAGGQAVRDYPRLRFGGRHLEQPQAQWLDDVAKRAGLGLLGGALAAIVCAALCFVVILRLRKQRQAALPDQALAPSLIPWGPIALTFGLMSLVMGLVIGLASGYHVLGTDRTGNDVLWQALKSIRTAWVIGSLTTVAMLPPALLFGIAAGYFKGWVDDAIQYLYTTLTSIPGVLLIAACVLMMQVYIDAHASAFPTAAQRADLRLFMLCMILGLTGWAGLCRLLRSETLKLRELEYVQAARAFGVGPLRIMVRHLLPNLMHIVLITVVLDFSGLVLYEAVLSYLGIGVDPSMNSFGSMIEKARLEMSRDPMIWWNLLAAFTFMLAFVLAANLFSDGVRDAFDPRSRQFKPRKLPRGLRRAQRDPLRTGALLAGSAQDEPGTANQVLPSKVNLGSDKILAAEQTSQVLLQTAALDVSIDNQSKLQLAVKALSISVRRGETFALVGESGSGKSVTAMALMRLLPEALRVTHGQILLNGEDLNSLSEAQMRSVRGGRIGMIFQEPGTSLNPVMRVGDQLIEVIERHTPLRGQQARLRAIKWLERVGIPSAASRLIHYPFQFSGGQKQRIMIAIALAAQPALLVADEPTTALDVTVQAQILRLLADIQQEFGMAVLLITHDLAVVRDVADTVALMRHGEVVEMARAQEFFATPKHPYARELFDAIPTFSKRGKPLSHVGQAEFLATSRSASLQPSNAQPFTVQFASERMRASEGVLNESEADLSAVVLEVRALAVAYPVRAGFFKRIVSWTSVVQSVDFSLRRGQTLALVGASGCGKTTVAKTLLRLMDRSARIDGFVQLGATDLLTARGKRLRALRRKIQIVFQDPYASLDPRMRVGEILQEGIAALRPEWSALEQAARIAYLLKRVGLPEGSSYRFAHEFSGGQRQRIAIARALAVEPEVLILDEPTSALDVSVQAQILDLLSELQRETGMAYLFITHNFGVVEYFADQVAVMDGGRIVELGEAGQVLQRPNHQVTQALLAAVPRLSFEAKSEVSA